MSYYYLKNKETNEIKTVPNKYDYSTVDFTTAYLYYVRLDEKEREKLEIIDSETKKPLNLKRIISNDRYLLYLDKEEIDLENIALNKTEIVDNVGYMQFIDEMVKEFEEAFNRLVLSNQEKFTDYLKYKVLGDIAYNEGKNAIGQGLINSSTTMTKLLDKYNISIKTNSSLFSRISDRWERGERERIQDNYEKEVLDKIPDEYKEKYSILNKDNQSTFDVYRDTWKNKFIVENIEKIEGINSKIKFLINFSENSNFKKGEVLTYKEMNTKTELALLDVKQRKERDGYHTYDKLDFTLIIDDKDGMGFNIIKDLRHDIGDYSDFNTYIKNTFSSEFLEDFQLLCGLNRENEDEEEDEL